VSTRTGGVAATDDADDSVGHEAPSLDAASEQPPESQAERDARWMGVALEEARAAADAGDVPVGAVVVSAAGELLGRGRNRREVDHDPTAHAEVVALRAASAVTQSWRLAGATVYATLEPCPMCAGALVNARVARVVYGCDDPKAGAVRTLFAIGADARLNHRFALETGVRGAECADALKSFFAARRVKRPGPS